MENQNTGIIQPFASITDTQIQDWKAKRGQYSLSQLDVPIVEGVNASFILAIPDQKTFVAISEQKSEAAVNKMLIGNCVLGGDLEYLEKDAQVYASVLVACAQLLKNKPSSIKKI